MYVVTYQYKSDRKAPPHERLWTRALSAGIPGTPIRGYALEMSREDAEHVVSKLSVTDGVWKNIQIIAASHQPFFIGQNATCITT